VVGGEPAGARSRCVDTQARATQGQRCLSAPGLGARGGGGGGGGGEGDVAALQWLGAPLMPWFRGQRRPFPLGAFPGESACIATRHLGRSGGATVPSGARKVRPGVLTLAQRRKKVRGEG
jgi:hypothetical protein